MIWKNIFSNIKQKENLKFNFLNNKNLNTLQKKNIILILKKFNQKNKINVLKKFLNNNYKNVFKRKKIEYKMFLKNNLSLKKKNTDFLKKILLIHLNKKQTYCNLIENNKNIFFLTNGIVLTNNEIKEKKRKKELKFTIINVSKTLSKLKLSESTININKLKPFLNKILKLIKVFFKKNENKLNLIVSPKISFSKYNFKKVKSIKRRLRKKYNLLDF